MVVVTWHAGYVLVVAKIVLAIHHVRNVSWRMLFIMWGWISVSFVLLDVGSVLVIVVVWNVSIIHILVVVCVCLAGLWIVLVVCRRRSVGFVSWDMLMLMGIALVVRSIARDVRNAPLILRITLLYVLLVCLDTILTMGLVRNVCRDAISVKQLDSVLCVRRDWLLEVVERAQLDSLTATTCLDRVQHVESVVRAIINGWTRQRPASHVRQ